MTGREADWPDRFDPSTGHLVYYGDNRRPGHGVFEMPGNRVLDRAFEALWRGDRHLVPPFLVFEQLSGHRDFRFLGVAAPGDPRLTPGETLVPRWYLHKEGRFQNLEAHFTILDAGLVDRSWIDGRLHKGEGSDLPAWAEFVSDGRYRALAATPIEARWPSKAEQLPSSADDLAILKAVHGHFSTNPYAFERFAGELFEWHRPGIVGRIDFTQPYKDGGRDATGDVIAGLAEPTVIGQFALEAKCHHPSNGCGTRQTSRLLARLRYRMFGVFVTTSYVDRQAWREARLEDRHPVVFITGRDVVDVLKIRGLGSTARVAAWLRQHHPV